ncbi:MAG: lysophospholipid acyltransferase family protein [Desulfobacterales bacterium]
MNNNHQQYTGSDEADERTSPIKPFLLGLARILYQPYKWLFFIPFLGLSTCIFGSLAFSLAYIASPRFVSFITGSFWSRTNSFFTPMIVEVTGKENIDKKQSYVIVSNHQSHYDIFVLYGWIGVDFKWVMKSSLRKVPFLGPACAKLDHVFIDRSNPKSAIASINRAKEKIVNGTSVIFFAEGTRSETGSLIPFKKGAFRFALDIDTPILPVTIIGTRDILPKGTMNLFPGKVKMVIHPPVAIEGYKDKDIQLLMDDIKHIIQSALPPHQQTTSRL